jgi:hypothetical protein
MCTVSTSYFDVLNDKSTIKYNRCNFYHVVVIVCVLTIRCIDGQVRLVRLVSLQTDNFRLFVREQTDKRQTSVCRMKKR